MKLLIEVTPDLDGIHCGSCDCTERGLWCGAFGEPLEGPRASLQRVPECLAAEQSAKRLEADKARLDTLEATGARLGLEQMGDRRLWIAEVRDEDDEPADSFGDTVREAIDALRAALEQGDEEGGTND